jgi:hypothetical protein
LRQSSAEATAELSSPQEPATAATRRQHHRWLVGALLLAFLVSAVLYSIAVPIWEAPDEPEHFQYVYFLLTLHRLPNILPTITPYGNQEGKQPPLYYLLAVPFAAGIDLSNADCIRLNPHVGWPKDHAIVAHLLDEGVPYHGVFIASHRIHLFSAALGTLTIALTYGIGATCLKSRRLGLLAAAFAAVLPGLPPAVSHQRSGTFRRDKSDLW